jgi:hypothetical protein
MLFFVGFYFSPLLALVITLKMFVTFYIRKVRFSPVAVRMDHRQGTVQSLYDVNVTVHQDITPEDRGGVLKCCYHCGILYSVLIRKMRMLINLYVIETCIRSHHGAY